MKNLGIKWISFLGIVLDPWFLVFVVLTIIALGGSILIKDNSLFSNLLAVIGSITGGIAGGIFQNEHTKSTGEHVLRKKGQSAIRNLKSIQIQVTSLRTWVINFGKKATKGNQDQLGEINRHLATIELNVNSGYEDWIDIDPGLQEEKEFAEKQKEVFRTYATELLDQKLKLVQTSNTAEKILLEKKISELEKQIKTIKKGNDNVLYAGNLGQPTLGISYMSDQTGLLSHTCGICGKQFYPNYSEVSIFNRDICSDCKKK